MNMLSSSRIYTLLFSVLAIGLIMAPSSASGQTEAQMQRDFLKFLDNQMNIEGWVDSDGDIQFEYRSKTYFIQVNENEPKYFRVVLFNIWNIESIAERSQVLSAADIVNRTIKVVKAYTTSNDRVSIAMELFLNDPDDYKGVLEKGLRTLALSYETFLEEME